MLLREISYELIFHSEYSYSHLISLSALQAHVSLITFLTIQSMFSITTLETFNSPFDISNCLEYTPDKINKDDTF